MRAKFARTLRLHMRDADLYTHPGTHVWTDTDSSIADVLLRVAKDFPADTHDEELLTTAAARLPNSDPSQLSRVWKRMHTFPYIFELAVVQQTLDSLTLQGTPAAATTPATSPALVSKIHYQNWHVALKDFANFRLRDTLSPALFEHLAQIFREQAPPFLTLANQSHAKKRNFSLPAPVYNEAFFNYVCYPYFSPVGYLTLYVLQRTLHHSNDDPTLTLFTLQHAHVYDEHTRATTAHLRTCFPTAILRDINFPKEQASDFTLLAAYAACLTTPGFKVTDLVLTDLRATVLTYIETLERHAATASTTAVESLLSTQPELENARDNCFSPLLTASHRKRPSDSVAPPPPKKPNVSAEPPPNSLTQLPHARTTRQSTTASLAATDAEKRASQAAHRGIGDIDKVTTLRQEAEQQSAR